MSREIKFRAWVNGHWTDFIPVAKTLGEYNESLIDTGSYTYEKDNPFVVEQYTGLKDKNGKEIYEGDIVRTTDRVTVKCLIFPLGVVEFKQQAFWICNVPSEHPDFTHNETLLRYWEKDLEVIGNIHENPELIGGEE